jgi:hypothetical protein
MFAFHARPGKFILAAAVCLSCIVAVFASDEPTLSKEQIRQFLLTAKVVASKQSDIGITQPWRLTLSDGTVTHDASFQAVDEHKMSKELGIRTEMNFVDSTSTTSPLMAWPSCLVWTTCCPCMWNADGEVIQAR